MQMNLLQGGNTINQKSHIGKQLEQVDKIYGLKTE